MCNHRYNMEYTTKSPEETFELARKFAKRLKADAILALTGELGAGKTKFVQGLAAGLGVPKSIYVRSPSFTLMNEYDGGRLPLYHFDFYRLNEPSELEDLGLEEYFEGGGLSVVEWADRFPGALPRDTVHIEFRIVDDDTREIEFAG
ncbi:MAG: tRNA (adenosine(37)-N6)-threonylcarbamoyltransferase complex ATPase subunit type 1 TsaE [Pseudomonadota bacterium]